MHQDPTDDQDPIEDDPGPPANFSNHEKYEVFDTDRIDLCISAVNLVFALRQKPEGSYDSTEMSHIEQKAHDSALTFLTNQFTAGPSKIVQVLSEVSSSYSNPKEDDDGVS